MPTKIATTTSVTSSSTKVKPLTHFFNKLSNGRLDQSCEAVSPLSCTTLKYRHHRPLKPRMSCVDVSFACLGF